MPITPEILEESRRLISAGQMPEGVIQYLRDAGLSKLESVKVLVDLGRTPPTEAKRLVHLSPVWTDAYERDERLHDRLEQFARTKGQHQAPSDSDPPAST